MLPIVKREMEMDEDNKCEVKRIKQEQVEMAPGEVRMEMDEDNKCEVKRIKQEQVEMAPGEVRMEKFEEAEYKCDLEGCTMSFGSKQEPTLHNKHVCPDKKCRKMFSGKYLVQHMWIHTPDRPYICAEPGCGHKFRFSSGSSRHKKKTGHLVRRTKESSRFKIVNGALVGYRGVASGR